MQILQSRLVNRYISSYKFTNMSLIAYRRTVSYKVPVVPYPAYSQKLPNGGRMNPSSPPPVYFHTIINLAQPKPRRQTTPILLPMSAYNKTLEHETVRITIGNKSAFMPFVEIKKSLISQSKTAHKPTTMQWSTQKFT